MGQSFGGANDFEWRSASNTSRFTNVISYGGGKYVNYYNETITAVGTLQANIQVCKQGHWSHYTCGTVTQQVRLIDAPFDGLVWAIRNNEAGDMAVPGDSGGPVFGRGTAYGLCTAVGTSPEVQGQLLAMPIQRISSLNLAVLTFP